MIENHPCRNCVKKTNVGKVVEKKDQYTSILICERNGEKFKIKVQNEPRITRFSVGSEVFTCSCESHNNYHTLDSIPNDVDTKCPYYTEMVVMGDE